MSQPVFGDGPVTSDDDAELKRMEAKDAENAEQARLFREWSDQREAEKTEAKRREDEARELEEAEPAHYSDVKVLAQRIERLMEVHGWVWPELPEDFDDKGERVRA